MTYLSNTKSVSSALNSTTTVVAPGVTWSGTPEINSFPDVMIQVATDQDGILYCDFSVDGVNWDTQLSFTYDASRINPPHIFVKSARYFRARFINNADSGTQTYFRLNTYYGELNKLTAPVNGTISENYDAITTRPTEYKYEVAMGKRQGRSTVNKFGYNSDVDTGTDEIVASFGGAFEASSNIVTTPQTFTIAYTSSTDGSGTSGATSLLITYIDENDLEQNSFHTLGNTGSETTSFSGIGINRALVYANGGAISNVNDITITATVDSTTQAQIPASTSVTQQCIFHTQVGHTLLLDYIYINALKLVGGGTAPRVEIKIFSYSRVTNTRYRVFDKEMEVDVDNNIQITFSQPLVFTGREVIWMTASTTQDNTRVSARLSGILERV